MLDFSIQTSPFIAYVNARNVQADDLAEGLTAFLEIFQQGLVVQVILEVFQCDDVAHAENAGRIYDCKRREEEEYWRWR